MSTSDASTNLRPAERIAAWAVHALTASGALWGLCAIVAIGEGRFRAALGWMAVALVVDGIDGPLARRFAVERGAPLVDGPLLDNLIDYVNYVLGPAYLIHRAGLLPPALALAGAGAILLAAAFQFSHVRAKNEDGSFNGFPSCWNVVAFYLLLLRPAPPWALGFVVALCVLSFVPLRYVHPARTREHRALTLALTLAWGACLAVLLLRFPEPSPWLVHLSLLYVVYWAAMSLWLTSQGGAHGRSNRVFGIRM